ncbi:hypothetical protein WR25_27241 [Diploscapter pachys]|uniref:Cytochrome c oxidase assembly protein COX15 homolog n=1 Tax=Diploscapter pachys TaxID=2018661 RepID=A0A2A2LDA7_9BILA|nr:hypothetical protein WR25_27241 [Diploscapter pachys]
MILLKLAGSGASISRLQLVAPKLAGILNSNVVRKTHTVVIDSNKKKVGWWLLGCAGMCYGAVALGGVTRLTESGLSMVNWDLFRTMKPPFSQKDWETEFERYKQFPEYKYKSSSEAMTMSEFKFIWTMEYLHRMWGRAIGIVFLVPCAYFWYRGYFHPTQKWRMLLATTLLLTQGGVGWWMVKSGLDPSSNSDSSIPRVSQYRLATHLTLAFVLYSLFFWNGLVHLLPPQPHPSAKLGALKGLAHTSKGFMFATAIMGAFVAGLDAGLVYNSWPKYADKWMPENLLSRQPTWKNFFENDVTVQFMHRNLLNYVPVWLAALHQSGSMALISCVLWLTHELRKVPKF